MSNQEAPVDFVIDFTPHSEWEAYTGEGGNGRCPLDGQVAATITKIIPMMTKPKDGSVGKPAAIFHVTVQDEDNGKGVHLSTLVLCGGEDKNQEALSRQLMAALHAAGTSVEKIRANAKAGAKMNASQLFPALIGKTTYVEIVASSYKNRETTDISDWSFKERYEQAKLVGAHRRPRAALTAAAVAGAASGYNLGGGSTANGTPAGTQVAPTGSSAMPML